MGAITWPDTLEARDRLICALDVPNLVAAHSLATNLVSRVGWFKVGLELFTFEGPKAVKELRAYGKIMLDLKLHDIPETVSRTVKQCIDLGADMLTVHTAGGRKMMEEAAKAANGEVKLLGVTVLTSLVQYDLAEVYGSSDAPLVQLVLRRSLLAADCYLSGVVASPQEAHAIRKTVPDSKFLIVTPGIRPAGGDAQDQKRVATAGIAIANGSTHLVVGRPLRDAPNPQEVADSLVREIAAAL
jgi:orotidine-5'-phosphate decarboxylase